MRKNQAALKSHEVMKVNHDTLRPIIIQIRDAIEVDNNVIAPDTHILSSQRCCSLHHTYLNPSSISSSIMSPSCFQLGMGTSINWSYLLRHMVHFHVIINCNLQLNTERSNTINVGMFYGRFQNGKKKKCLSVML